MCENIKVDKYKQMKSSRQNDKFEQWVMYRAVKDKVLRLILGNKKRKVFSLFIYLYHTASAFLSVSLLITLQLKAETHLTNHRPLKQ